MHTLQTYHHLVVHFMQIGLPEPTAQALAEDCCATGWDGARMLRNGPNKEVIRNAINIRRTQLAALETINLS